MPKRCKIKKYSILAYLLKCDISCTIDFEKIDNADLIRKLILDLETSKEIGEKMSRRETDLKEKLYDTGEDDLITKLYHAYNREMFLMAMQRLRDKQNAEDAVQMTFFIAIVRIDKLKESDNKKFWLVKVMSNVIKQYLYNKKYTKDGRLREILTDAIKDEGYYDIYDFEYMGEIEALKGVLKEREYQYVYERFVNCRSNQELAEIFGLSYSGATSFGDRVMKKVKKFF